MSPACRGTGRGVRRRDVLRAVRHRRGRRSWPTSAMTSRAGSWAPMTCADLERTIDRRAVPPPMAGSASSVPPASTVRAGARRADHRGRRGVTDRECSAGRCCGHPRPPSTATPRHAAQRPSRKRGIHRSDSCAASASSTRHRSTTTAHRGGYAALDRALEIGPGGRHRRGHRVEADGRGGAAFPTGRKWAAVAGQTARPHYLVCNADESEAGTFKDRVLLEGDPFAIVEAMTIAAFATGSARATCISAASIRRPRRRPRRDRSRAGGEPPRAGHPGLGLRSDVEVRRGAGAYICGEETALFESIEGKRGEPRNKPPFRSNTVSSASRPWSTTSRRWPTSRWSWRWVVMPTPGSAPRGRPGRGCSACQGTWRAPGSTRSSSGRRWVT